jgi:hypothetical protein
VLEKNQTLFLEPADPDTGFQLYRFPNLDGSLSAANAPIPTEPEPHTFGLPKEFWGWLESDDELKRAFHYYIEEKVTERVTNLREQIQIEEREISRNLGIEVARIELKKLSEEKWQLIEEIASELKTKKMELMNSHAASWLKTLMGIVKRFFGMNLVSSLPQLEIWLKDTIQKFGKEGKMKVYLSQEDWNHFKQDDISSNASFQIMSKKNLSVGQIECEWDEGGVLFDQSEQLDNLEKEIRKAIGQ